MAKLWNYLNNLPSDSRRLANTFALLLLPVVTSCCSCPLPTIPCIITLPSLFFFLSVARRRAAPGRRALHCCFSFPTPGLYWSCVWARPPPPLPPPREAVVLAHGSVNNTGVTSRFRGRGSAPLSGCLAHQNSSFMGREKRLRLLADGSMLLSSAP